MQKNQYPAWTESELETLRFMASQGATPKEIAFALKRSYAMILKKMRLIPHPPYVIATERIRELAAQGLPARKIGDALGMTRMAVHMRCRHHGIKLVPGKREKK